MGQAPDPDDPLVQRSRERWAVQRERFRAAVPSALRAPQASAPAPSHKPSKAAKHKHKRKIASASRKANKKRKRR
jgi:hypothetical protein